MKHVEKYFILPFVIFMSSMAFAENNQAAADRLVLLLEKTSSFESNFEQRIHNKKSKEHEITKGKMFSKKPNLFRWEINEPFENIIISNGEKLYNYDKDLEQVTVQTFNNKNFNSTPFFLSGDANKLKSEYKISIVDCINNNFNKSKSCFKLIPKDENVAFQSLTFGFENEKLQELLLLDQLGQTTFIKFLNPKLNVELNNKLFGFAIPSGVDVIESE